MVHVVRELARERKAHLFFRIGPPVDMKAVQARRIIERRVPPHIVPKLRHQHNESLPIGALANDRNGSKLANRVGLDDGSAICPR